MQDKLIKYWKMNIPGITVKKLKMIFMVITLLVIAAVVMIVTQGLVSSLIVQ